MIPIPNDITALPGCKCVYDVYGVPAPAIITKVSYNDHHELRLFVKPDTRRKVRWTYAPFWKEEEAEPTDVYKNFSHFYRTNRKFDPSFITTTYKSLIKSVMSEADVSSILLRPDLDSYCSPQVVEAALRILIDTLNSCSKRLIGIHEMLRDLNNNEQVISARNTFTAIKNIRELRRKNWIMEKEALGNTFFSSFLIYDSKTKSYTYTSPDLYYEIDFYFKDGRWCARFRTVNPPTDSKVHASQYFKVTPREDGLVSMIKIDGFVLDRYRSVVDLYKSIEDNLPDISYPVNIPALKEALHFDEVETADPVYVRRKG